MGVPPEPRPDGRRASDLLRRHYIALHPALPLGEAEGLLRAARARCLPVVADGRVVGVLSYRTLLRRYAALLHPLLSVPRAERAARLEADRARPVAEAMSAPAETARPDTPLPELARRLRRLGTGCIPVLAGEGAGEPVLGIVTESDLLRAAREPGFRREPQPVV